MTESLVYESNIFTDLSEETVIKCDPFCALKNSHLFMKFVNFYYIDFSYLNGIPLYV
jgi:hypothetical protein